MLILAHLSRWNLHGTLVSLISLSRNSTESKPVLTANGMVQMLALLLIARRRANTTKVLGLFD